MGRWYVFLALALLLSQVAIAEDILDYEELNLSLTIDNSFDLVPKGSQYSIQKASAELSWIPIVDYRQNVESISNSPSAIYKDGFYIFTWQNPHEKSFSLKQTSLLYTNSMPYEVRKKVAFPLQGVSSDLADYLKPAEIIDLNSNISSLASQLAEGEDDAFIVVSKLAGWVESNVRYDLSTTTADASQKASWVLENRVGVCDELTSLFISMTRSLGIPARFVSGVSYSNVNQQNDGWGPHGWAEVYFPEVGWVPFDITYKEWGYVDATHIKLKTSTDAKETSLEYRVTGSSVNIKPGGIVFDVDVLKSVNSNIRDYDLSLEIEKPEVGFGSYNLIKVKIKNLKPYYVSGKLYLSNVSELEILGSNSASFVITPRGEKEFFWIVRVSPELERKFIYTIPIKVSSSQSEEESSSFQAQWRRNIYSKDYMMSLAPKLENKKEYSEFLVAECIADASEAFVGESVVVDCTLQNNADRDLPLRVCLYENCSVITIREAEIIEFTRKIDFNTPGIKTAVFSADSAWASKNAYITFAVVDKPKIILKNLTYPKNMSLDDIGEIEFTVQRESVSSGNNVVLKLKHGIIYKEWNFPSIENTYDIRYKFSGKDLFLGENKLSLILTYEDGKGNKYASEERFDIKLEEKTTFGKFKAWLNGFDRRIDVSLDSFAESINKMVYRG